MRTFLTDTGTLRLMEALTPSGRCVLHGYLRQCDAQTMPGAFPLEVSLNSMHFTRKDIRRMKLKRQTRGDTLRIIATTDFTNGSNWKNGHLRVAGVTMPDTMLAAVTGRHIEDVMADAPLKGDRITRAKQLAGQNLQLVIDVGTGPIPYVDDRPSRDGSTRQRYYTKDHA